ncbi:MAG: hypothetical protein JXR69_08015 [Candidatus Delongbacteria bacterium]|nr:hypothetical protein [Candidatus Delongbacteria bacterium]
MNRILYLFVLVCFTFGYSKTIYGEYTYTYGDDETLTTAKQKCQTLAKRDAVEKFATYITSETVIRNYQTESDEIIANTEAMITDVKTVEERIDKSNTTIYYKVSAEVDEEKILAVYNERERIRLEKIEAERKLQADKLEAERKAEAARIEAERKAQELKLKAEKEALEAKLKHEKEMASIEQETEKLKLSREINEKDRRFWKTQKWIALGAFAGSAALGTYFNFQGSSNYDDYKSATTTASADDLYDKAESNYLYRDVTFSVSVLPLGYFFYAWYKESQY